MTRVALRNYYSIEATKRSLRKTIQQLVWQDTWFPIVTILEDFRVLFKIQTGDHLARLCDK